MVDQAFDAALGGLAAAGVAGLAALHDLLHREPASARALADRLVAAAARAEDEATAGRTFVALAAAHLAAGKAQEARRAALEGASLLGTRDPAAAAVAALRLAQADVALGDAKGARAGLARTAVAVLALGDDRLETDIALALRLAGDGLAADVVDHTRRTRFAAGGAGRVAGLVLAALRSAASAAKEPLYAILRAALEATGAERGFVLVYDDETLRFELGLAGDGGRIEPQDFAVSMTIVERALESGKPVLVPDVSAVLPFATASSARELGLASAACVPLRLERKRIGAAAAPSVLTTVRGIAGVLYVDARAAGSFSEASAPLLELLADGALIALRAARLEAALREVTEAERTPRRSSRAPRRERAAPHAPAAEPVELAHGYEEIVTRDPGLRAVLKLVDKVAPTDASVLVRGESGTGKELVARALHRHGRRASGPFVAIDCGALQDELLQHELFGHETGAFTGAGEARAGLLERAHGGTLFLDEVGAMSPALQAALLRVLQEGEVRRLGGTSTRAVQVRVVSATSHDLRALVEEGRFRHDLLFRLSVVNLDLPPLRDRPGDIPLLVERLLAKHAAPRPAPVVEPPALARLEEHAWPGNVRELENLLRAALATADGPITLARVAELLGPGPRPPEKSKQEPVAGFEGTFEEVERRVIEDRLERHGWNLVHTARSLGFDRTTLRRKIVRYGIARPG